MDLHFGFAFPGLFNTHSLSNFYQKKEKNVYTKNTCQKSAKKILDENVRHKIAEWVDSAVFRMILAFGKNNSLADYLKQSLTLMITAFNIDNCKTIPNIWCTKQIVYHPWLQIKHKELAAHL